MQNFSLHALHLMIYIVQLLLYIIYIHYIYCRDQVPLQREDDDFVCTVTVLDTSYIYVLKGETKDSHLIVSFVTFIYASTSINLLANIIQWGLV